MSFHQTLPIILELTRLYLIISAICSLICLGFLWKTYRHHMNWAYYEFEIRMINSGAMMFLITSVLLGWLVLSMVIMEKKYRSLYRWSI